MSELNPRDAPWWLQEAAPQAGRRGRWALLLAALGLLVGAALLVVFVHLAPSVGAAGGCGGG